jgi:hypothetical protein
MLIVKVPCVEKEEFGDVADFTGRQRDTVFIEKSAPNLFALAVMDKSLKPHEGHDVIAYGSAGNDMLSKRKGPSCNKTPRSILTPVCTNMDGFPNLKLTMAYCLTVVTNSLLNMPRATTDMTKSGIVTN